MATHRSAPAAGAVTYTAGQTVSGPAFTCARCARVYAYPVEGGRPVRCECGWWYRNLGHGKIVEEWRPRIGGAKAPIAARLVDDGSHGDGADI